MSWHFAFYFTGGSWRWRNVQARLIGIGFIGMGLLHLGAGLFSVVVDLRTPPSDGQSRFSGLIFVGSGVASIALGRRLCRRPAYRPDLGDVHPMLGKAGGYNAEYVAEHQRAARRWWTGDPLPSKHRDPDV